MYFSVYCKLIHLFLSFYSFFIVQYNQNFGLVNAFANQFKYAMIAVCQVGGKAVVWLTNVYVLLDHIC